MWSRSGCWTACPAEVLAAARELGAPRGGGGDRPGAGRCAGDAPRPGYDPAARRWRSGTRPRPPSWASASGRSTGCAGPLRAAGPVGPGGPAGGAGSRKLRAGPTPGWSRWYGRSSTPRRDTSTGTRARLIRRVAKAVEDGLRPGRGAVAGPDDLLQADRHADRPGGTRSGRRSPAGRPRTGRTGRSPRRSPRGRVSRCRSTPPRST